MTDQLSLRQELSGAAQVHADDLRAISARHHGAGPRVPRPGSGDRAGIGNGSAPGPVPLVVCRDARLVDMIAAAAASAGVEPLVLPDHSQVRQHWAQASAVVIGVDCAGAVAGLALPERAGVYVVGTDAASASAWSVPLSAAVIELPQHAGFLPTVLGQPRMDASSTSTVLDIVGGSGGVGASTLAAALAQRCAARARAVALVDCDANGGGLDLMFAAEHEPGWRWPELSSASGTLGDLTGRFPRVADVDLLSVGRSPGASGETSAAQLPSQSAFRSVLDALARSHDVLVIDNPHAREWGGRGPVHRMVVVAAEVRAVMAARSRVEQFGWQDACAVVRTGPGMSIAPGAIAENLGMVLAGVLPTDRRLVEAVATGIPLGRGNPGRRFRFLDSIVRNVCGDA